MFVGKVDRDNTIHLLKMRIKENFYANKIGIFVSILFGINLITLVQSIFKYSDKVSGISSNVFSLWGFNITLIVCGILAFDYKNYYNRHQIYPQNNFSRLTSHEIYCYINFFLVQVYCLFLYLLEMAVVSIINIFSNNIELAYQFNLQYIFSGFFVTIVYGFLLIAIFNLYATLLRKFKIPFGVLSVVIILYLLRSPYLSIIMKMLNFYIKEPSIPLFLMKAVCTWLIIVVVYHMINKYTKYYEKEKYKINNAHITIMVVGAIFVFLLLGSFQVYSNRTESANITTKVNSPDIFSNSDSYTPYKIEKVIDVSSISEGSNLTVQLPTDILNNGNLMNTSLNYGEEFTNPSNDKIEIEYIPSSVVIDYINLTSFTNPELDVRLEDNKININEKHRKNVKVVMISPYTFMKQFDYFKGKQILKENIGNMQGNFSGYFIIYQPEGKKLQLNIVYTNDK